MEKETKLDDAVCRMIDLCYLRAAMATFELVHVRNAMDCPSFFANWMVNEMRFQTALIGLKPIGEERIVNLFWDLVSDE